MDVVDNNLFFCSKIGKSEINIPINVNSLLKLITMFSGKYGNLFGLNKFYFLSTRPKGCTQHQ